MNGEATDAEQIECERLADQLEREESGGGSADAKPASRRLAPHPSTSPRSPADGAGTHCSPASLDNLFPSDCARADPRSVAGRHAAEPALSQGL